MSSQNATTSTAYSDANIAFSDYKFYRIFEYKAGEVVFLTKKKDMQKISPPCSPRHGINEVCGQNATQEIIGQKHGKQTNSVDPEGHPENIGRAR